MKVMLMSPSKIASEISEETGITIKVLFTMVGILISVIGSVSVVGISGILKINSMENEITALGVQLKTVTDTLELTTTSRYNNIVEELNRRTQERWTKSNMASYSYKLEQTLRAAGIDVALPEIIP